MARTFSMATVFRMSQSDLLREFFTQIGLGPAAETVPWDAISRREIGPLMNLYTELPPEKQAEVELLLREIHTLACEKDMESLAESVGRYQGGCEGWKDFLRSDLSVYNKSFVAWLYHRDIFDSAIRYFELDAQSWWKKRVGLPKMTPVFTDSVRSEIEKELENLLWEHQGRGNLCTVEMVERGNGVFYFFAYPDDYVKDSFVHDSTRNLMPQTIRQTFELVFAYDSTEGSAELSAKLPKKLGAKIEEIFMRHLLRTIPDTDEPAPYNLSMLLDPDFTLPTLAQDQVRVRIVSISLWWDRSDHEITFASRRSHTVREQAMSDFRLNASRQDAVVTRVKFRFERMVPRKGHGKNSDFRSLHSVFMHTSESTS